MDFWPWETQKCNSHKIRNALLSQMIRNKLHSMNHAKMFEYESTFISWSHCTYVSIKLSWNNAFVWFWFEFCGKCWHFHFTWTSSADFDQNFLCILVCLEKVRSIQTFLLQCLIVINKYESDFGRFDLPNIPTVRLRLLCFLHAQSFVLNGKFFHSLFETSQYLIGRPHNIKWSLFD